MTVFQITTNPVVFTISSVLGLRAPYEIITHIARESVKNICPAAANQVSNFISLDVSTCTKNSNHCPAPGRLKENNKRINNVKNGVIANIVMAFPTE
jgi:hypothetical protein